MKKLALFIFTIIALISCKTNNENIAPDKNFYYSIEFPTENPEAQLHAAYIAERIPQFKYAITNSSGYHWPFYQSFDRDENVAIDSLMPPHWFTHKMIPAGKQKSEIDEGDYYVMISLYPEPDTLPNYNVIVYKMEVDSLHLSATTGVHYIQPQEYTSNASLSQLLLETVLRYSFK